MAKKRRRARRARIKWQLHAIPGGYRGTITIPVGLVRAGGRTRKRVVKVRAKGKTKGSALSQAASMASKLATNPVLSAVLPPGSGTAIKAVGLLSKAVDSGAAGAVLKKLKGPGAKRLVKTLKFW